MTARQGQGYPAGCRSRVGPCRRIRSTTSICVRSTIFVLHSIICIRSVHSSVRIHVHPYCRARSCGQTDRGAPRLDHQTDVRQTHAALPNHTVFLGFLYFICGPLLLSWESGRRKTKSGPTSCHESHPRKNSAIYTATSESCGQVFIFGRCPQDARVRLLYRKRKAPDTQRYHMARLEHFWRRFCE